MCCVLSDTMSFQFANVYGVAAINCNCKRFFKLFTTCFAIKRLYILPISCEDLHSIVTAICHIQKVGAIKCSILRINELSITIALTTKTANKRHICTEDLNSIICLIAHIEMTCGIVKTDSNWVGKLKFVISWAPNSAKKFPFRGEFLYTMIVSINNVYIVILIDSQSTRMFKLAFL